MSCRERKALEECLLAFFSVVASNQIYPLIFLTAKLHKINENGESKKENLFFTFASNPKKQNTLL